MAPYDELQLFATSLKATSTRLHSETLQTQQSDYKINLKSIEVEKELRQELHGAVFTETPGFLGRFFHVPHLMSSVFLRKFVPT